VTLVYRQRRVDCRRCGIRVERFLQPWRHTSAHTRITPRPREVAVVELIAQGRRNKEIAGKLGISVETTKVHVRKLLGKLAVRDRAAAVTVALRRGIIHLR
jgi:DNA-binding NarL/FixJ family response regulator